MKDDELTPELSLRINALINAGILEELSRRGMVGRTISGFAGLTALATGLTGCKTTGSELRNGPPADQINNSRFGRIPLPVKRVDGSIVDVYVNGVSFYDDADSITGQDGFQVTLPPNTSDLLFLSQAGNQGRAIGAVIGFYLAKRPYEMIEECIAKADQRALYKPAYGPLFVFQHAHVIDILKRTNHFTVDPYTPMMALATSGHPSMGNTQPPADSPIKWVPDPSKTDNSKFVPQWSPKDGIIPGAANNSYFNHYMLGTDQDDLYVPDSLISRHVVNRSDIAMLRPMIRKICESLVAPYESPQQPVTFDAVTSICRIAPVLVVAEYLGLPSFKAGATGEGLFRIEDKNGNPLSAGSTFEIDDAIWNRYKFRVLPKNGGLVPSHEDCYQWVKESFRNTFNNFGDRFVRSTDGSLEMKPDGSGPRNVREEWVSAGVARVEMLLAWSARVIEFYKKKLDAGDQVPDTMITRLIKLQKEALANPAQYVTKFGCFSEDELRARVADDRIQVNAFGAFVGAVANPEEANARIIDGLLDMIEGTNIEIANGSYAELRDEAAKQDPDMKLFNRYALEFLRLRPQGEVLLRVAVANTTIAGARVSPGTLIFNSHGAAMRDPKVLGPDRLKFDSTRQDKVSTYQPVDGKDVRQDDDQHSVIYLQHGYGRHKCLGRYASEMTMEEVLRAVVRLGNLSRASNLEMDPENLYAMKLEVKVTRPSRD